VSTFFAFLHLVAAFTLVAALAVEFVLIRQEVTRSGAVRLLATDAVLGVSATTLLVVGLLRVFYFEKGELLFFEPRLSNQVIHLCYCGDLVRRAHHRIPVMAQGREGWAGPVARSGEGQPHSQYHPL
jgi:predicted membrane protein DUF2214